MQRPPRGDDRPVLVGSALRDARLARRWTLEHVAERAGMSAAFLSRLERGKASSSLSNLIRLSSVLAVPLERLFAVPGSAVAHGGYVVRRGAEGGALSGDVYRYKPLAGGLPHHAIWLFELEYPPGKGGELGAYAHDGEEVLYVLRGEITFTIGGERLSLRRGDCVQFDARQPHGGRNPGKGPAAILMILAGHAATSAGVPFCAASASHAQSRTRTPGRRSS